MDDNAHRHDHIPYRSDAFAFTHPSRLGALARLTGILTADPRTARVLELGCASGGNLIPMALQFPEAHFLGIDLNAADIARGTQLARTLDIQNLELRVLDILNANRDLGQFDYIIAHGMHSWVPAAVREKMFAICAEHLAPNGIAYFGFNTLPGRNPTLLFRELLMLHAGSDDAAEQIAAAHCIREVLGACLADQTQLTPQNQLLKAEVDLIARLPEWFLAHDHAGPVNEPVYFNRFISHAATHGLQFVAEAVPHVTALEQFGPKVAQRIREMTSDLIEQEQWSDILGAQSFRRTILTRANVALDRASAAQHVRSLYVSSYLTPHFDADKKIPPGVMSFTFPDGRSIDIAEPFVKLMLICLGRAWPASIGVEELIAQRDQLAQPGQLSPTPEQIGAALVGLLPYGAVEFDLVAPPCKRAITDRPLASTLARMQADRHESVTSLRHHQGDITPAEQFILARLDGQHTREQLLRELQTQPDAGPTPEQTLDHSLRVLMARGFMLS